MPENHDLEPSSFGLSPLDVKIVVTGLETFQQLLNNESDTKRESIAAERERIRLQLEAAAKDRELRAQEVEAEVEAERMKLQQAQMRHNEEMARINLLAAPLARWGPPLALAGILGLSAVGVAAVLHGNFDDLAGFTSEFVAMIIGVSGFGAAIHYAKK